SWKAPTPLFAHWDRSVVGRDAPAAGGTPAPLRLGSWREHPDSFAPIASGFLVVSIQHGGNIRRPTSQETHGICLVMTRPFLIFLSLVLLLHLSPTVAAAETSGPGRESSRRARVVMVQEADAT